ncbi:MAG: chemotaxis response regulator protein-glutamate methylesterase [Gemmatimonas sp.]|nr:chemotaxis response regulator protein-glutamate methylesterase [Gemmatimonas sp.]
MARIRVLVVDDAVVVRKIVTDALASDPDIEVVGAAANGRIALAKLVQVNPDVVTMDIEMPEMNGLDALRELRKTHPVLPVIMFSTLTERGGSATLEALALGATDYVTKPANVGSVAAAQQRIRDELIPKIKALCGRRVGLVLPRLVATGTPVTLASARAARAAVRPIAPPDQRIDIVAIGVSTGGPNALATILPKLPRDFPVPIVIVQHMPPVFTRLLADRLRTSSQLDVREGVVGGVVEPGRVWIAPGDRHMLVKQGRDGITLALNQNPPENSCRPSVDPLFRSVGEVYGARVLGVILTGMGQDGLRGSEELTDLGACVIAQDQATSVVWGMPGFVANAGLAERLVPLEEVAGELVRRGMKGRRGTSSPTTWPATLSPSGA